MQSRSLILLASATVILVAIAIVVLASGERGVSRYDRLGAGNDGVYLRKPGEAQTWLARGTLDPSGDPASWLDRQIIDISEKKIAKVILTQADGSKLVIGRAAPDAQFAVEDA